MLRGASFNNNPNNLRSANRSRNHPENRNNNIGFRASWSASGAPDSAGHRGWESPARQIPVTPETTDLQSAGSEHATPDEDKAALTQTYGLETLAPEAVFTGGWSDPEDAVPGAGREGVR